MNDALLPLAVCVLVGLFWYDALRARELAIALAHRLCSEQGAQLLDQSVALHRLRPLFRGRPALARSYRFELSYTGNDRHRASLTLIGGRLVDYSLPAREEEKGVSIGERPTDGYPATSREKAVVPDHADGRGGNVVPITHGRRTLH